MPQLGLEIAGRQIGPGNPPYVIAEIGINHGGSADVAREMISVAPATGVDAVKLQTFKTGCFLSRKSAYFDVLAAAELSPKDLKALSEHAATLGVTLFSAVFDEPSADVWNDLNAAAFKIASGDITHLPLLRHVAALDRPVILSSGGATMIEIARGLGEMRAVSPALPVAVLHCVSHYPTQPKEANLACMAAIRAAFDCPVGFSDHTLGTATAVAAVALGADIIEKHFTLDRAAEGPDHALSADPDDMKRLVADVMVAWESIGKNKKAPVESADHVMQIRRSLVAERLIKKGEVVTRTMLGVKRPGTGVQSADIANVIGKRAAADIDADDVITWDLLEE